MNENRTWKYRFSGRGRHGLFWGLILVAVGGFWLMGSLEIVPEPAKIVIPGLVILWGIATIFIRRDKE